MTCFVRTRYSCRYKKNMFCVLELFIIAYKPSSGVGVFHMCLFVLTLLDLHDGVFLSYGCVCTVFNTGQRWISKQAFSQPFTGLCLCLGAQDSSPCLRTQQACLIHEAASKLSYASYISHCSLSSRCWTVSPKLSNTLCGVDGTRWKLIEGDCICTCGCVCTCAFKNSEVM